MMVKALCGVTAAGMGPCVRKASIHTWHITPHIGSTSGFHIWIKQGGGFFAFGEPSSNLSVAKARAKIMDKSKMAPIRRLE